MVVRRLFLVTALLMGTSVMGTSSAQMSHGGPAASMSALAALVGGAFDVAFMSQMIAHHKAAITMARAQLAAGSSVALKAVAWDVVQDQEYEIGRIGAWLREWYATGPDPAQLALMDADMRPMLDSVREWERAWANDPSRADRGFVRAMIPHHQQAIAMARLALTRASRPELREFARALIVKQSIELKQLVNLSPGDL